jgi:V/A-type H+-transporting ATPase subunit A
LQNNLATMEGVFLKRGEYTEPMTGKQNGISSPGKKGDTVTAADWLGEVMEGWMVTRSWCLLS